MRLRWLLLGLAFLLAACAAPKGNPKPQSWVASPNNGELVIYRTRAFAAGGQDTYFYIDGVHVGTLGQGNYTTVKLPPGSYRLDQKWPFGVVMPDLSIDVEVPARQKRYVRLAQDQTDNLGGGVLRFHWQLGLVPEKSALVAMHNLGATPPINTAP